MDDRGSIAEREIFAASAAIAREERAAFLDSVCADRPELRAHVEQWLRAHESSGFMADVAESGAPQSECAGERIGHYELLEPIGEGGFGVVWMAEQRAPMQRRVALKIIKLGMDTREVVARFEQERQALAMMDHPHIARVFDAGATPAGRPYFVMEFVSGVKLTEYCDEARLGIAERLRLFIAVCQAVQHAHQKGIIHRDLKPSNILVAVQDGVAVPKVIDFGVAKAIEARLTDATLHTRAGQMIGTPLYMSPEQADSGSVDIDTRSDIYSLGVLLYELLTGRTPIARETLDRAGGDEARRLIREQEPVRPSQAIRPIRPMVRIPSDLDWITMKALEKDRARRYDTANDLALDLQRHLASEPVLARPASQLYRLRRMVRRNRLAFTAGALVVAALVAGLGFSTVSFFNEQEQRRIAERERGIAETQRHFARDKELAARQRRYVSDINLAHQSLLAGQFGRGRRLLDAHRPGPGGESELRGWEWRWLWQQLRGEARATLSRRDERATSVSFSPDGRRVAVASADGRVEICAADASGPPVELQREGPAARVVFSPVADALVFAAPGGVVQWHDCAAQQTRVFCRAPAEVHDLSFSADGVRLAVLTRARAGNSARPDVRGRTAGGARAGRGTMAEVSTAPEHALVVDTADGRVLHTLEVPRGSAPLFNDLRLSPDGARLYVTFGTSAKPGVRCIQLDEARTLWEAAETTSAAGRKVTGFSALAVSPDGRLLATATGYDQRTIQLWDAQTGARLRTLAGHRGYIADLAFSPDGRTLASASTDETLRLWDTATWSEAAPALHGHGDEVAAVAFSPDAQRLATAGRDGLALLWEPAARPAPGGRHPLPAKTIYAFLVPGGRTAFALKGDGTRSLIDVATERETPLHLPVTRTGYYGGPNFLGYPDGAGGFRLFEITEAGGKLLAELPLGRPVGDSFAYSPEARLLAWSEPGGKTIHVTPLDRPGETIALTSAGEVIFPGSFDTTGRYLLGVGPGGDARVWDIARRTRLPAAEDYLSPFGMIVFGNLRNALGTQAIRHWVSVAARAQPPRHARTAAAPPGFWPAGSITGRAYSPDGRTAALAVENGSVLLFDAVRQEKIATLHGRAHAVFAVAFSPDGTRLLSAGDAIWDVATGQELVTLSAEGALHTIAQFGDDGSTLLVGSWHGPGEAQVWRAPSWAEIAATERATGAWPRSE